MTSKWRAMSRDDLAQVTMISATVHGVYAEPWEVYAERLELHPAGCWVCEADDKVQGFIVAHPWRHGAVPSLGALIGAIPVPAASYYLHDIALLPQIRGSGAGGQAVALVEALAKDAGVADVSLVAVNGADRYWARHGFVAIGESDYGPGTHVMRKAI